MNRVLIVGGGFGGIQAALDLSKSYKAKITLVSDKSYFEHYPTLYRVLSDLQPETFCIPLTEIFKNKKVKLVIDKITAVDLKNKFVLGRSGQKYDYDYLVLAIGAETAYFDIPGLKDHSFSFKSIGGAWRLKQHINNLFKTYKKMHKEKKASCRAFCFVIVGGGATGVELAGELVQYVKELAHHHKVPQSSIKVDVVETLPRIIPSLPRAVTDKITKRLNNIGVNVLNNNPMVEEKAAKIITKELTIESETVIWTAGVRSNQLHSKIGGFELNKQGRVIVDEYLRPKGFKSVFVIGDGASTPYSGLAQTALVDGRFVAETIERLLNQINLKKYKPVKPYFSLPIGKGWAVTIIGPFHFYGFLGWLLRMAADMRYFFSILPPTKAWRAFRGKKPLDPKCKIC